MSARGARGPLADTYATLVVRFRHAIVLAWLAFAIVAVLTVPPLGEARGGALGSLVPSDADALQTRARSAQLFRFPVLSNTAVVQRHPDGLSAAAQAHVFARAVRINAREYPDLLSVAFALPVTNTLGVFPGSRERSTTAITYLYFERNVGLLDRDKLAHWFTERRIDSPDDALVGVTGVVPARVEQGRIIRRSLPVIEGATVLLIALVLGVYFRALGAPLAALAAVGISFIVALRLVALLGGQLGVAVPRELEPIMLVLLLGIVTDYSIFFLSAFRQRLREGEERLGAAALATRGIAPIVVTAGLIVAVGTASLLVARLEFFRIFGPGLALTVLVGLLAAVTLVPALLALLGRAVFWPAGLRMTAENDGAARRESGMSRRYVDRIARSRPLAAAAVVGSLVVFAPLAAALTRTELGPNPIAGLPASAEPREAAEAAAQGFAAGITSPTLLLVEGDGVGGDRAALARLQALVEAQPGVAAVIGPGNVPADVPIGAVVSASRAAARYVVVLEDEPLSRDAVSDLRALRAALPGLLDRAGLPDARFGIAGNTALAGETVDTIVGDLARIGVAAIVVNLVLLVAFLRALVAPVYLLATSVLALAAALGLTVVVFQLFLGHDQLTYYVPFMAAVLLVSLGSDYNVFLVGRIWQEATRRSLQDAIVVATPRASRAISVAGVALASSFALLALVPLAPFREFAFAMSVGVVLEAFLMRPFVVPALVSLVGPRSAWPGGVGAVAARRSES